MKEMTKARIEIGETAASITCEERFVPAVIDKIAEARAQIKSYIRERREFLLSLVPLEVEDDAPEIIRSMCEASTKANVGPMASVAGAVALAGLKGATEAGSSHCIVDNGGDIAMILERPVSVGILDQIESDLVPAFQLPPTSGRIVGLCTSSGVFGHSISFGLAEAASVMAHNPILADALATSLGNSCKDEESMIAALEAMRGIEDVIWAMAIVGERIGTMGEIPRMIQGVRSKNNITVHSDFRASISHH